MIIKVAPDKEKAKSLLIMVSLREQSLKELEKVKTHSTIIAETYYEIIKELCTAIALAKGYKSAGDNAHKDLIAFVKKYGFEESEIESMQDLRIRRNKSSYEGKPIEEVYLENKKQDLLKIIEKSKKILKEKLSNEK